jgi:DNA-binding transcriptional regulator LsrR (DeoR family)
MFMPRKNVRNDLLVSDQTDDLAVQVAWLSYIGGLTQAEIAARLSLSRAKVHRLINEAHRAGFVHVFIDRSPERLIRLEDQLSECFDLVQCIVVPDVARPGELSGNVKAVASAGARYLQGRIASGEVRSLGVSWGRTLAQVARMLPRSDYVDLALVSLMGSLTLQAAMNPFDVIYRLAEMTGGQGFFLPAPFIANSVGDKQVLVGQRSVQEALERARSVDLCCLGIGALASEQPMFAQAMGLLGAADLDVLIAAGAQGELAGQFVDARGRPVDNPLNDRIIGVSLEELRSLDVLGMAAGEHKVPAISAVLHSGVLNRLIIDETAARMICGQLLAPA